MYIGEDILLQILLKLPPKALMRSKSVCKSWYALIGNLINLSACVLLKRLVPGHKDRNYTTPPETVFSLLYFCKYHANENSEHSFLSDVKEITIPSSMRLKTADESLRIIGQCNGIVCLASTGQAVFLWNPTFDQDFKLLPPEVPLLPLINGYLNDSWDPRYCRGYRIEKAMGFGYDPKSKDYKVVGIGFSGLEKHTHDGVLITRPPKVIVYTMRTDAWREINTSECLETEANTYLWPERFQIYSKGMCYWFGREQRKQVFNVTEDNMGIHHTFIKEVIISFDTSSEVFHEIPLPYELKYSLSTTTVCLTVWNVESTVALFACYNNSSSSSFLSFGIWLMDDDGGATAAGDIWTKHFTVECKDKVYSTYDRESSIFLDWALSWIMLRFQVQVAFWGDEILTHAPTPNGEYCLVSYNIRTKTFKNYAIQNLGMRAGPSAAITYINSI